MPNAVDILVDQHTRLREQAGRMTMSVTDIESERMLEELIVEAAVHTHVEVRDFYPSLAPTSQQGAAELQHALATRIVEHRRLREAIEALRESDTPSADRITSLCAAIESHADAEERDLFPLVRAFCATDRLEEIGDSLLDAMDATAVTIQDEALARARSERAVELTGTEAAATRKEVVR